MNYPFELRRREATAILRRRLKAQPGGPAPEEDEVAPTDQLPEDAVGLALPGGGIRAATFSLGIIQALAKKDRLRKIDFMSTVSGGGYTGAFLGRLFTWIFAQEKKCDAHERVRDTLLNNQSPPMRWLRANANYIVSRGGVDVREHLAVVGRNLATIYFVLGLLLFALFGILRGSGGRIHGWLVARVPALDLASLINHDVATVLSPWWWLPVLILVIAVIPMGLAYWLAPKADSRADFDIIPLIAWVILLCAVTIVLGLQVGNLACLFIGAIALVAVVWLESASLKLPPKLDRSTGDKSPDKGTVIRNRLTRGMGEALVIMVVSLGWVSIDTFARAVSAGLFLKLVAAWAAVLTPIAMRLRPLANFLSKLATASSGEAESGFNKFISPTLVAALVAFPLAVLLLVILDASVHFLFENHRNVAILIFILAALLTFLFGRAFDFLNFSALQQSYRARLSRTFLGACNPARSRWGGEAADVQVVHPDDDIPFDRYHPEYAGGPLHLIGLCVNETVDVASQRDLRERKGLPMCVSACGVSVGRQFHSVWSPLEKLSFLSRAGRYLSGRKNSKKERPIALRPIPMTGNRFHVLQGKSYAPVAVEPLTLSSWTAISGAAFGTGTGRTTSLPLALLFGLANLRLGYWWNSGLDRRDRPGQHPQNFWRGLKCLPAKLVPMQSLLLSDFLAKFRGPSHRFWNISDGGHFDVTALYELIRRRTPFIIGIDAGVDPKVTFKDHGEFLRQVRMDFGAEVTFLLDPTTACKTGTPIKVPQWIIDWLNPDAFGALSVIGKENGKYAALACVRYGEQTEPATWIVLLKACLIKNETLDVAAYALSNPNFPTDTTLNQFYDDEQWESYRKLGESVGEAVLS